MSKLRIARRLAVALGLSLATCAVQAKAPPDQVAKLGNELTPVGAEKAGNADGTIPAWTAARQGGALKGEYPKDDAFDVETPLFTITAANYKKYEGNLTEGHKELLRRYPDRYKLKVYPSHRDITFPEAILQATRENAARAELADVDSPKLAKLGFPFPIPRSGAEPIWNHKLKWRGESIRRYNNQAIVQPNGSFQLTKIVEDGKYYYANPAELAEIGAGTTFIRYLSETIAPPRMAGTFILVHEKAGTGPEGRAVWLYSPGLKRIRRAPAVCCDNPYEGTDGHQFYDQVDMFNGVLERYTWKLVGKREVYIPYHANKIAGPTVKYAEIVKGKHLNQDLPRYERHRVWVVEADNRPNLRHTFKKRRFYLDEDSWNIVAVDNYDQRDQFFQFQEGHLVFSKGVLAASTVPEVIYHFDSGRYFVTAMYNEDQPYDGTQKYSESFFEASTVQKRTSR
ncbi:MAG: DUF1329 domain-containing protein [Sinimarinibacterium sp.]|jgi:hypothetical protein